MFNNLVNRAFSTYPYFINIFYVLIFTVFFQFISPIDALVAKYFDGVVILIHAILNFYIFLLFRCAEVTIFSNISIAYRLFFANCSLALLIIFILNLTNISVLFNVDKLLIVFLSAFSVELLAGYLFKQVINKNSISSSENTSLFITNASLTQLNKKLESISLNVSKVVIPPSELDDALKRSLDQNIQSVYIYLDNNELGLLADITRSLNQFSFEVFWIMPESLLSYSKNNTKLIIKLNEAPVYLDASQYILKRSMDIVLSFLSIIVLSPLFAILILTIYVTDGSPVIYSNERYGQYGKIFKMYKFRTLKVNSDLKYIPVKFDDKRITRIGKILRKLSLDELPQLINVLKGEMSIVGPRPHVIQDTDYFSKEVPTFLTRHHVKPGITGLAQIKRRGKTINKTDMNIKLEEDLRYINEWSLFLDLKILLLTPWSLLKNWNSNN
jgi:lipopolysaccharide/colanic/teichoic acid biosynthesis glycosyltransferase